MSEQTEEEYLIERLSKLLAEISVIVNGPQPMGVLWSYADLPQKVQALKDAAALNAQAGVDGIIEVARDWNSRRGQISGSLASQRIYDAEAANILRGLVHLAAVMGETP